MFIAALTMRAKVRRETKSPPSDEYAYICID